MIITYKGKGISTNEAYSGGFSNRHGKSIYLLTVFRSLLLPHKQERFEEFEVLVTYNGRYDIDNIVATVKIFVDAMREAGLIKDDTKKFFKRLTLTYQPEQENPSFIFEIKKWN